MFYFKPKEKNIHHTPREDLKTVITFIMFIFNILLTFALQLN